MRLWQTPRFWYDPQTTLWSKAISYLLIPLSIIYDFGRRTARYISPAPQHAQGPVICIGNLTAGGSGKTPAALAIVKILRELGFGCAPAFVTRGYGGFLSGPLLVDPSCHTAQHVGDEALLLVRQAQTCVARDRAAGAALALLNGANLVLLDDGFQNTSLHKDISLLVIDGASGFGNGRLLPAGPLREPLAEGFARADAFVMIGPDLHGIRRLLPSEKPLFEAHLHVLSRPDPTCRWVAFAGLGRPEKFLETLRSVGVEPVEWVMFPDHHPYTFKDLKTLVALAHARNARLLTTEKDAVRLPPDFAAQVETLPVTLNFMNTEDVSKFFETRLRVRSDRL